MPLSIRERPPASATMPSLSSAVPSVSFALPDTASWSFGSLSLSCLLASASPDCILFSPSLLWSSPSESVATWVGIRKSLICSPVGRDILRTDLTPSTFSSSRLIFSARPIYSELSMRSSFLITILPGIDSPGPKLSDMILNPFTEA
ncbi:hypothetical protein D3C81_1849040 [compost metagenome]